MTEQTNKEKQHKHKQHKPYFC